MQDWTLDFGMGTLTGGLAMSACWGLFWLAVGVTGVARRTCHWRVVMNSLTVAVIPLALASVLVWLRGPVHAAAFTIGLSVMPSLLVALAARRMPDGGRAGDRMLGGVRHLMEELLGKHRGCGGCSHEHDREGCA